MAYNSMHWMVYYNILLLAIILKACTSLLVLQLLFLKGDDCRPKFTDESLMWNMIYE